MLPINAHVELSREQKWDRFYKLPGYVERYITMMEFALPNIEIRPWTINRCISFFENGRYINSLTYDQIEEIMS